MLRCCNTVEALLAGGCPPVRLELESEDEFYARHHSGDAARAPTIPSAEPGVLPPQGEHVQAVLPAWALKTLRWVGALFFCMVCWLGALGALEQLGALAQSIYHS